MDINIITEVSFDLDGEEFACDYCDKYFEHKPYKYIYHHDYYDIVFCSKTCFESMKKEDPEVIYDSYKDHHDIKTNIVNIKAKLYDIIVQMNVLEKEDDRRIAKNENDDYIRLKHIKSDKEELLGYSSNLLKQTCEHDGTLEILSKSNEILKAKCSICDQIIEKIDQISIFEVA